MKNHFAWRILFALLVTNTLGVLVIWLTDLPGPVQIGLAAALAVSAISLTQWVLEYLQRRRECLTASGGGEGPG